ncbi:TORTIFOLIA1-like protein 2 isoform X2 [Camellia sinensis]|uniref:TORTIFOLIA1-like protein 2 isoform X2 n=1 Tax=Camellia sinensis TaxID=4442 RepID=UPI001035736A|nr:TORTIFOLIA1-like protein 2 isoform X2 [Camellia sinensis]
MKTHAYLKAKGTTRVNHQQEMFELKQRVVFALNKLADRDTHQIGVEELEKTIECLNPDGVAPFLSCILDTDSEQKSTVRKECIRLMGLVVAFHEGHIAPHLGKVIASIVKRLKDPDSVVRDACVETVGVLASKLSNGQGENDGAFVAIVKPLFEALGEQNKQVQSGAGLCLARAIDSTNNPPVSILQRMLTRTIKLLKNPHFMAKPAVIELNRSIIQAGGAPTQCTLSAAISSIQEALKNSDWSTRKAASLSLGEIASSGGSVFSFFKASCIRCLESCRFDKVKPVRDTVLQALHLWRRLPGPDTPEPSEAGSSIKENFCGGDNCSANESGWKDALLTKVGTSSIKKRLPLSVRKTCQSYVGNPQHSKANDWHIEIAVPKTPNVSLADVQNDESEGSSVTKTFERVSADITIGQDIGYEYVSMDDRQDCSSVSNIITDNFETKFVTKEVGLVKQMATNQRFAAEEISSEEQRYSVKMQDRRSLDSTVSESNSQAMRQCCSQTVNEMASIQKQLLEIENKQSNLMDLLKVFTTSTIDSLSSIQLKVSDLEHAVDRIAQDVVYGGRYSDLATAKLLKKSPSAASPRLSTCTPRPSEGIRNRQPSLLCMKNTEIWEEQAFSRSRSNSSATRGIDMWSDATDKIRRKPIGKGSHRSSGQGTHFGPTKKTDAACATGYTTCARQNSSGMKNNLWTLVKGYLSEGDLDSAYAEALCSGDELVLIELLDRTGPVLESLSNKTSSNVLGTLASYFLEQRFINSIIPWLQQVVDLSAIHGPNYLGLSAKARQEFLSAIREAANQGYSNLAERSSVTQLAVKLHQIWGGEYA